MSNWKFAMTNSQFFLFQKLDSVTTRFTPEGVHTPCLLRVAQAELAATSREKGKRR